MQAQDFFAVFDRSVAWGVYLGAAALLLGVLFWVTRRWQRNLRWLLLALLALAALMPAPVPVPGHAALAPAFMVVALAALAGSIDIVAPVAVRFLLAAVLVLILVIAEGVWWRRRRRRQPVARRAPAKR